MAGPDPSHFSFLENLPLARAALAFATAQHRGQRREADDAPFIVHPLEVAALLCHSGHSEEVVVAAILHDTVEDTHTRAGEIEERFGSAVAKLVAAMTEDPAIDSYEARKAALRDQITAAGPDALAIYAADKVVKVRELRAQASHRPRILSGRDPADTQRLQHYDRSLALLEAADPTRPLVRQLRFELEALRALPPAALDPHQIAPAGD